MCEIFGVSSLNDFTANDYLRTFYSHSDFHPHGWGLACISRNGALVEKESVRASESHYLRERLSQPISSKILLAHIRYATIGNVEYKNCHPFTGKDSTGRRWTLIHNGTIFDFAPLNPYVRKQKGDTDSERIFLYLTDRLNEEQHRTGARLHFEERFALFRRKVPLRPYKLQGHSALSEQKRRDRYRDKAAQRRGLAAAAVHSAARLQQGKAYQGGHSTQP